MKTSTTAIDRARIACYSYGIDLTKDFFSQNDETLDRLEAFRKLCNFTGRNELGRSRLRQFYYHLQKGWNQYDKILKI